MARTNAELVKAVLAPGNDYDEINEPSLDPFITAANQIVSWCVTNASNYGRTALTTGTGGQAETVETWLAAGLYKLSDQQLASSQAGRSSGHFRGSGNAKPSERNEYLIGACAMDMSRMLKPYLDGAIAGAVWLGLPVSSQTPYRDRD